MRILLTGATGFIGRRIGRRMIQEGHELFLLLQSGAAVDPALARCEAAEADIRQPIDPAVLRGFEPEVFIHAAALVQMTASRAELVATNVAGCAHAIELALAAGARRVVHVSSTFAVGPADYDAGVRPESWEERPDSAYGESRLEGERVLRERCREKGVTAVTLRPGNIYGEGHPCVLGTMSSELETGAPSALTEWHNHRFQPVHVSDVVEAVALAVDRGDGIYTIHDGRSPTIGSIIEEVFGAAQALGMEAGFRVESPPGGPSREPIHFRNSIDRARRELAFEPRVDLRRGLLELLRLRYVPA